MKRPHLIVKTAVTGRCQQCGKRSLYRCVDTSPKFLILYKSGLWIQIRLDPYSLYADPNPTFCFNVDPDLDPEGKMNADPTGSGSTALIYTKKI